MGIAPERNPGMTVKCLICGRENPVGRLYCQFCRQRLPGPLTVGPIIPVDPIVDPPTIDPIIPVGPSEVESLQATLKSAQDENLSLRRLLEPMQEELARLRAASVHLEHPPELVAEMASSLKAAEDKAANLLTHVEGWKDKWKSAEGKAAALEAKLVAKAKEIEELFKNNPGTIPNPRLKFIFAIITILGSLGGYGAGRYVQPKNDASEKVKQLVPEVASAQQQIDDLKSSLNAANAKADQIQNQLKSDLDSANQKNGDLTARQQQVQHQLKDAAQKASIADQVQKELRQNLDSANRKISVLTTSEQQLQREFADANAQKTSISQTVVQLNAEIARLHAQVAPKGYLVWSGNLAGKRTINIKNGVPDFGALSGALPQKPCKVSTEDAGAKIKNRPSKNHLNDLSFEVSGSGLVQVRIDWEISQ